MKILSVRILHITIPFNLSFSHSLATRKETNSLICILQSESGELGYGEGAPRPYVTGETLEHSKAAATAFAKEMVGLEAASRKELLNILSEMGSGQASRKNPAAWCALEIAALDLFSKELRRPMWQLFSDAPQCKTVRYSAVFPLVRHEDLLGFCHFARNLQLNSVKAKLQDPQEGLERLMLIRSVLGKEVSLRVDFNGALTADACIQFLEQAGQYNITAIEQPVPKSDLEGLREVARRSEIPIIADESMYTDKGPEYLINNGMCHGLNVRISSCGGILRSLNLLHKCHNENLICQLGAQVGETAILTAAQQNVAAVFGVPDYIEGAAGSYLLHEDVCIEDVSFGKKGLVPISTKPGLGVHIDEEVLARWSEPIFLSG